MNEKEVGELRRRLRPEKNSITHIRGCYVNEMGESVAQFDQSLALMTQEETETLLALLRRTLSGTLGKNLLDLSFETRQGGEGEEHRRLMRLRDTALKDEEAVEEFFQLVRQSPTLEGNYLILLVYDRYDVPYRAKDGERQEDAAAEVYSYLLCSICPVKQTKPALSYHVRENEFHNRPLMTAAPTCITPSTTPGTAARTTRSWWRRCSGGRPPCPPPRKRRRSRPC